jgi:hypothetical protein
MIEGSCHCGAVHWRFEGVPESATACNCTVCRRYGALWVYGREGEEIEISGETRTYARGDKDLNFHACPTCNCIVWWKPVRTGEDWLKRMGVNLRMADPEAVAAIPVKHLDGFGAWTTVERAATCVGDMWF